MPRRKPIAKFKRPYLTRYYNERDADEDAWVSHGASNTWEGAARSAVWRILVEQHAKAVIYDRATGAVLRTIVWDGRDLRLHFGRLGGLRALRAVK